MRLALVRLLAGLIAGIAVWTVTLPAYTTALAAFANRAMRADQRFAAADIFARDEMIRIQGSRSLDVRADQITYNVILLFALFAANRAPVSDRNARRFLLSLAITCAVHFLAVIVWIEASYATLFGAWSEAHYGAVAANVWVALQLMYQVVGMFAVVFLCWWLTSAEDAPLRLRP